MTTNAKLLENWGRKVTQDGELCGSRGRGLGSSPCVALEQSQLCGLDFCLQRGWSTHPSLQDTPSLVTTLAVTLGLSALNSSTYLIAISTLSWCHLLEWPSPRVSTSYA